MPIVVMSERGQLVIPQEIRRKLDLVKGRKLFLEFSESDNTITLRPMDALESLRGFLKSAPTTDRMLRIVRREERRSDERKRI
jgi:AbrB family looped-hinge helix DNA binding protein